MIETNEINVKYQFTAVPTNLFLCMDNNCRSMLFTLVQLSTYYAKEDGFFFRTNADLQAESNLSENVVRATLSTLYEQGLIEVKTVGASKGKVPNYFKVNTGAFEKWEKIAIEDCMKNPVYKIETPNYKAKGFVPSYLNVLNETHTRQSVEEKIPKNHNDNNSDVEAIEEKATVSGLTSINDIPVGVSFDPNEVNWNGSNTKDNPRLSMNAGKSEDNINNKYNRKNKDLKEQSKGDDSKRDKLKYEDYWRQVEPLMDKLYKATDWIEFRHDAMRSLNNIINKAPNEKCKVKTIERMEKIKAFRYKYFIAIAEKSEYNPLYKELYEMNGWKYKKPEEDEENITAEERYMQNRFAPKSEWQQTNEEEPTMVNSSIPSIALTPSEIKLRESVLADNGYTVLSDDDDELPF